METKNIEITIDGKHSYGVNLQTKLENHIIVAKMHTALMEAIPVELPVMLRATEIKLYRPYYLGSDDGDYNGEDILFITEDKAWDYIHGQCCNICKKVNNGVGSQCESEWYVVKYDSCEST